SEPAVFCWSASKPRAVLLPEVFKLRARNPTAVLKPPVMSEKRASKPTAVLSEPLVTLTSAPIPKAVLSVTSLHICGHCAPAFGASFSDVRATISGRSSGASVRQWRNRRVDGVLASGVGVVIKQAFLFSRLVNCATERSERGKEAVGRSALSRVQALLSEFLPKFRQLSQAFS